MLEAIEQVVPTESSRNNLLEDTNFDALRNKPYYFKMLTISEKSQTSSGLWPERFGLNTTEMTPHWVSFFAKLKRKSLNCRLTVADKKVIGKSNVCSFGKATCKVPAPRRSAAGSNTKRILTFVSTSRRVTMWQTTMSQQQSIYTSTGWTFGRISHRLTVRMQLLRWLQVSTREGHREIGRLPGIHQTSTILQLRFWKQMAQQVATAGVALKLDFSLSRQSSICICVGMKLSKCQQISFLADRLIYQNRTRLTKVCSKQATQDQLRFFPSFTGHGPVLGHVLLSSSLWLICCRKKSRESTTMMAVKQLQRIYNNNWSPPEECV